MVFPISIFLYFYFAFLLIWLIFCLVAVYHMMKFGFKNFTTIAATLIFISVAILMLIISFYYIAQIDWRTEVTVFAGIFNIGFSFN